MVVAYKSRWLATVYQTSVSCGFGPTISDDVQSSTRPTLTFSLPLFQWYQPDFHTKAFNVVKKSTDWSRWMTWQSKIIFPSILKCLISSVFFRWKKNFFVQDQSQIRSHDIRDDVSSVSFGWEREGGAMFLKFVVVRPSGAFLFWGLTSK